MAAGWLIDQAGWKGKVVDGLGMYKDQALVLTNPEGRPASAILAFAEQVMHDIRQQFNVDLDIEPNIVE